MSTMHLNLINIIKSIISINEKEIEFVKNVFYEKSYKKGDYFLKEGQVCREIGFIKAGLSRYFINNDGEELTYDFGKEGSFICNYESFLRKSVSSKNIQFIEDSNLLAISFDDLQRFYEQVMEGQKFGRIICEQIFVDSINKITSLYTETPEKRYTHFLNLYPGLQQRIPQYIISSYVGIKPQSLSRIRKRISKK